MRRVTDCWPLSKECFIVQLEDYTIDEAREFKFAIEDCWPSKTFFIHVVDKGFIR